MVRFRGKEFGEKKARGVVQYPDLNPGEILKISLFCLISLPLSKAYN